MIRKKIYLLVGLLTMVIVSVSAQNSQVLYNMNLPQNHMLNPALRPTNSLYIGLPAISGINLNLNNNFVNFSDVFMKGQSSDSIITFLHPENDVNDFLAKIKDNNSLESQLSVQLFGLGFSVGENAYVFLDINERVESNIVLPGDVFGLLLKGNEGFVGGKIDLSYLRGDMKVYHEIGLGFSKNYTKKLRVGVKGKLLLGVSAMSIDNRSLGIAVNEDYSHTLDADLSVNISAPLQVIRDADNNIDDFVFDDERFNSASDAVKYLTSAKNLGLGLDIGATYDYSDKIMFSAAITDLGFIRWNRDITNLKVDGQFEFSGLNISDVIDGTMTMDELGEDMLDSLKNAFTVSDFNDAFTTGLPFGVSVGGRYNLTKSFSLGLLSYTRFIGKQVRESLTLSANVNFSNAFSTSVAYTVANHRYDNLGAGLAFRAGVFQIYMMADRIPVTWNKIVTDESTIPLPTSWNTINLRLGMNLAFGNSLKKKNDKPMVVVE